MARLERARVSLKRLSPEQLAVAASQYRYNVVSGGQKSGKRTVAVDLLLDGGGRGALSGYPVAVLAPEDELATIKRRIFLAVEPLLDGRQSKSAIKLKTGGVIYLVAADSDRVELWDQVSTLVVVRASEIAGLLSMWDSDIKPLLTRFRGRAFIFSKPQGARNGFGSMFRDAMRDETWGAFHLPTTANPEHDAVLLQKNKETMEDVVFRQEHLGEVVDEAIELSASQTVIGRNETFLEWCDRLAADGLKVDGLPFRLDDRPTMRWIYSLIPSTIEEAYQRILIMMKCTQVGFTVMEMLAMIYMALKFSPCKVGMYLPDMKLAGVKSSERFMPIVRTVPDAYRLMVDPQDGQRAKGEGNVLVRNMGGSRFHFMWTSGKAMTESVPLDVLSFDEVQEMSIADMEKTRERLSASRIRYTLMGSTANYPDRDIHFWYKRGTQHKFHTRCPSCGEHHVLDDYFPECIKYDDEAQNYRYVCRSCHGWIDDPQVGEWRASNPDATINGLPAVSVHYPQFLSPTISAREIIEAYFNADDLKNFYNRKLGKPYTDPSQVPVNFEMLNNCAAAGMKLGVKWKDRASGTYMGIDQMGRFNVVLIAERLPSGHMAIIHAEAIYSDDPFARCSELMELYGVQVCVVEGLPNYNDAKRFAGRHLAKVFLAGYGNMDGDMMHWGDAGLNSSDRKTSEEDRDRYTVRLDQFKCMQVAMSRIQKGVTVFPDPDGLVQDVIEKGITKRIPILKDMVFFHFTRTALIAEKDEEEKKFRRKVVKVGIDPHFSYAYMLLNVAWARAHGTTTFLFPDSEVKPTLREKVEEVYTGLPSAVADMIVEYSGDCCGNCTAFDNGVCSERGFMVGGNDAACFVYVRKES